MPVHTVVRKRRKELGLTQEQVANALGVTASAVHKWEKGATYPDVTLLPALARLLKTDLNTLLCFQEELTQKELGLFINHVTALFLQEGFERAFAAAMEKVREYPSSGALLHSLGTVLQGALMTADLTAQQKQTYEGLITSLYERVVKCDDPSYTDKANFMLAGRLIADAQYEKAQETIDALPEYSPLDRRILQAQLWLKEGKHQEAAVILEHKLLSDLNAVQTSLTSLARIAVQEGDRQNALRLAQCGQQEAELFGLWDYCAYITPLETAVSSRDVEDSLAILGAMLAALLVPWDMEKSPICKHIRQKPAQQNFGAQFLPAVLFELENSAQYDFLRGEPGFQQLMCRYRAGKNRTGECAQRADHSYSAS